MMTGKKRSRLVTGDAKYSDQRQVKRLGYYWNRNGEYVPDFSGPVDSGPVDCGAG